MKLFIPKTITGSLHRWLDSSKTENDTPENQALTIDWLRILPFIALHLACLFVLAVGVSWIALVVALATYLLRMFAITAFYHRYFSHKSFKTSRPIQFIFALIGASAAQRGPLWWASHHRIHHTVSDRRDDPHSPVKNSFLWSHMGWFLCRKNFATQWDRVNDLKRFPELVFLDRFDFFAPLLLALSMFGLGELLAAYYPQLGTSGWQMLVWGFVISTVVLYHATFTINSVAHRLGSRRYDTPDNSRNNLLLALITLGEGWHNNHHYFPRAVSQGHRWWELDISFLVLQLMKIFGLVWGFKSLPQKHARRSAK